jgi:type IV secretory pathway TrbF-like protein
MRLTLKTKSNPADGSPFNPYVAARREWDERYGEIITRAKNWRVIAILSAMTTLVAVSGIVALSARSKVVPFVVAIDSLGRTVSAGPAEVTTTADEKLKKAVLFTWIEGLRLVTTDPLRSEKRLIACTPTLPWAAKRRPLSPRSIVRIRLISGDRHKP